MRASESALFCGPVDCKPAGLPHRFPGKFAVSLSPASGYRAHNAAESYDAQPGVQLLAGDHPLSCLPPPKQKLENVERTVAVAPH